MIIPQLPVSKIVEEDGYPTSEELLYRQNLQQALQLGASEEGLVAPTQLYAQMLIIQNALNTQGIHTCQFGTCLYVPDFPVSSVATPSIVFCVPDGSGNPLFKRVTLT